MKPRRLKRMGAATALCLVIAVAVRLVLSAGALGQTKNEWMQQALAVQNAFVDVAETTAKAVVTISAEGRVTVADQWGPFYFGPRTEERRGLGSGVIFDKRGYVITNDHVIEIATQKGIEYSTGETVTVGKVASEIQITLPDGRSFNAKVQGRDRLLDIAVLKMQDVGSQDLPAAPLGDSSRVRPGQLVVAIGNPYGGYMYLDSPQPTITDGIISALDRAFPREDDERRSYGGLIQTSAAINRGNSGGPLVNLQGEVIGINAAIFSASGGSEGVGFAIPINRVKARLKQLIGGEKIRYGYLGIKHRSIGPQHVRLLAQRGLTVPRGVFVLEVYRGSPADKAGLKPGDIIVRLGDKTIVNSAQLIDIEANTKEGTEVPITIVRDGKRIVKNATIGGRSQQYFTWMGEPED
jgi:S1-C subfamily serine protease